MKKIRTIGFMAVVASCGLYFVYCGGSKNNVTTDPTEAVEFFSNPTGTLSDSNATTLTNQVIEMSSAESAMEFSDLMGRQDVRARVSARNFFNRMQAQIRMETTDWSKCLSGDENNGTIDLACLTTAGELEGCTGTGKISFSTSNEQIIKAEFKDAGLTCSEDPEDNFSCDGSLSVTLSAPFIACFDGFKCTVAGAEKSMSGCVKEDGTGNVDMLVGDDDGVSVCLHISANSTCSSVCGDWKDKEGTAKIECAVTQKGSSCPPYVRDIQAIGTCVLTRNASCE